MQTFFIVDSHERNVLEKDAKLEKLSCVWIEDLRKDYPEK